MTYMVAGTVIWLVLSWMTVGGCDSQFISSVCGLSVGMYVGSNGASFSIVSIVLVLRLCLIGIVWMVGSGVVVVVGNDKG